KLVRPAKSPTIPYTTLFRSPARAPAGAGAAARARPVASVGEGLRCSCRSRLGQDLVGHQLAERADVVLPGRTLRPGQVQMREHQDRKSTRLNSSHVKISYAV